MLKVVGKSFAIFVAVFFVFVSSSAYVVDSFSFCDGDLLTQSEVVRHSTMQKPFFSMQFNKNGDFGGALIYTVAGIPIKSVAVKVVPDRKVYLGGMPLGFSLRSEGVLIIGFTDVTTESGAVRPAVAGGVLEGDIVTGVQCQKINGAADIERIVNSAENAGKELCFTVNRGGRYLQLKVTPAYDLTAGKSKVGVLIRESLAGIGTVTYINGDGGFGALGHPVCDFDTRTIFPASDGTVYNCAIIGLVKGERGKPGELRGLFIKSDKHIGTVKVNNKFGIFGVFSARPENELYPSLLDIGGRASAKPGKAKILATLDSKICEYDIEIVKTNYQLSASEKSMVIKVTDPGLLERTGGIVQGMSGSPIIQNGKLIGAVTHVFLNDPTRGYGLYIDWMLA
ncbi:MAG: SpoIVB peptidase [Clostridiales bacterium]|jgi:stage IV sporulation protein B|nr:SpoIVB peptidase [Clostridiales bacterium]